MKKDVKIENELEKGIIGAWIRLTGTLKNTRITQGMIYNEAIIMNIVYYRYCEDGEGLVSFGELVHETKMLKSLVNRTIDSLVQKELLERCDGERDRRTTYVRPVLANLDAYLAMHKKTLELVRGIVDIIGEEDAAAFVRISNKIASADPLHEN